MTCIITSISKLSGFVKNKRCPWNGEAAVYALYTTREITCNARNDRGISIVNSTCNVTSNILHACLVPCVEMELEGH
jgi:hypothetical protein